LDGSSAAMTRSKALRQDIAGKVRGGDWNYAVFNTETQHRPGANGPRARLLQPITK
jgi:hypothetical protein